MSYRRLPVFGEQFPINQFTAKQDKVQLLVGDWIFDGDRGDLQQLVAYLCAEEGAVEVGGETIARPVFQRRSDIPHSPFSLKFRSDRRGGGRVVASPLFRGSLNFFRFETLADDRVRCHLQYSLSLNPTRAINHQPISRDILGTDPDPAYPEFNLFRTRSAVGAADEFTTDGNDNVTIQIRRHAMSRPERWPGYLHRYVFSVVAYCRSLIERNCQREFLNCQLRYRPYFNLRSVENYWEWQAPDPARLVRALEGSFVSLGNQSDRRVYPNQISSTESDANATVLRTRLVNGVVAKIYAKTTRRIRIEIEHDLQRFRIQGGHTTELAEQVILMLGAVAENAASEAENLIDFLVSSLTEGGEAEPPHELVRHVVRATSNEARQRALLSLLVARNGYRLLPRDPLRPAVLYLESVGVLVRSRRSSNSFIVTPPFQRAREVLSATT